jgi:hypothetical protein
LTAPESPGLGSQPRLAIISLHAHRPLAPRGERTRWLVECFSRDWEVEVVAPPPSVSTGGASGSGSSTPARRLAAGAVERVLLDKWEPWSVQRLARWRPGADAAVLIGHPFSPLVYASRRLRAAGVPYAVDSGDPWALTDPVPSNRGLSLRRARRVERGLWEGASGGILTTPAQADRLGDLFPALPTLVRPNGYGEVGEQVPVPARRSDSSELRIAHFGMLSSSRLDIRPLLGSLSESGIWRRVVFAQFGDDFVGTLDQLPTGVEVERHAAYPWEQVVHHAAEHDLAVVVGNVNPGQLPSKAVQYMTLPIPRLAITEGSPDDALAAYVSDKPGWLAVSPTDRGAPGLIRDHLERPWTAEALRPPASEAWPAVAETIVRFVERCTSKHPSGEAG